MCEEPKIRSSLAWFKFLTNIAADSWFHEIKIVHRDLLLLRKLVAYRLWPCLHVHGHDLGHDLGRGHWLGEIGTGRLCLERHRRQSSIILEHLADIVEMLVHGRDFAAHVVHNEIHGERAVLHAAGHARVVSNEALQHLALLRDGLQLLHVVALGLREVRVVHWRFTVSERRGPDC